MRRFLCSGICLAPRNVAQRSIDFIGNLCTERAEISAFDHVRKPALDRDFLKHRAIVQPAAASAATAGRRKRIDLVKAHEFLLERACRTCCASKRSGIILRLLCRLDICSLATENGKEHIHNVDRAHNYIYQRVEDANE